MSFKIISIEPNSTKIVSFHGQPLLVPHWTKYVWATKNDDRASVCASVKMPRVIYVDKIATSYLSKDEQYKKVAVCKYEGDIIDSLIECE